MSRGEGEATLVLEAREMPAAGRAEEEVFAELAARTGEWDACVLALGVPRTDAEVRIHEVLPLFGEFEVGEEDLVAMLLACGHAFVVDRILDGRGEQIRDLSWTAACARGGFPGGMIPWFRTGELAKIFRLFTKTQFRDGQGSPPEFWVAMVTAGELLATEDNPDQAELTAGLEHSRTRATAIARDLTYGRGRDKAPRYVLGQRVDGRASLAAGLRHEVGVVVEGDRRT
ncbi:hypothetical protein [Streptomyces sp. NBC_00572]|uniref:hypothetical protein n=1 Tax=Streptomyces sp. NBC_00572 TaxID=2903664 RepID=UPI00224E8463|nr:hypothetical protein [Streptomyces sp. NBC_00572]MCX4984358.1 hypothetical protein [Streptomyces sp. NBC_00572]